MTIVLLALLVGQVAHLLAGSMSAHYAVMDLPPLSPPVWMFTPVWILLYLLMGCAAYRVWASDDIARRGALHFYVAQLALNGIWPMLFFRVGHMGIALVAIIVLVMLVFVTMRRFRAIDRRAGWLMLPYFVFLLFALYLTVGFAFLVG